MMDGFAARALLQGALSMRETFGHDVDGEKTMARIFGIDVWGWAGEEISESGSEFEDRPAVTRRVQIHLIRSDLPKDPYRGQAVEWAGMEWKADSVRFGEGVVDLELVSQ